MRIHTLLAFLVLALAACSNGTPPGGGGGIVANKSKLLAVLASATAPTASRLAADKQIVALTGDPKDATRLAVLEQIVWGPLHADEMRIYALDQLAAADPTRAGSVLMLHLPRMESWPVLEHACDLAVKLGDLRLTDPLTRSLVRPAKTFTRRDRPEAKALAALAGKPLDTALADRLIHATDTSARVAAMDLLAELSGPEAVKKLLREAKGVDKLTVDLQWWLLCFGTLPTGPQEVEWVQELHKPTHAHLITMAAAIHVNLTKIKHAGDYTFAPRFVGMLAGTAFLEISRADLLADINERLEKLPHVPREPRHKGAPDDVDESLKAHQDKLTRCDLWTIRALLNNLERPEFRRQVYELGLKDMSDSTTEHGGLIRASDDDRLRAIVGAALEPYAPLTADRDDAYIASDKLLRDIPTGLAVYHMHFQKVDNAANAGPGAGDLDFARETRCNCVVFTSVGKAKFNADYYTPAGAVIDLGVYSAD